MDSNFVPSFEPPKSDTSARDNLLRDFNQRMDTIGASQPDDSETVPGHKATPATDFLKSALLFMPMAGRLGKAATVATGLVYGLNEMDSSEGASLENLGRGAMGVTKGLGTRYAIGKIGSLQSLNFAARGVTMGLAARTIDVGCSPGTYTDSSGKFSLSTASDRMQSVLLDKKALGMDLMVIGLAHLPPSFTNRLGGADPLIKNMQMGASFGLATGTLSELDRQQQSGESFDGQKLAWSALSRGGLDALAAAPGGLYGRRLAAASAMHGTEASRPPAERPAVLSIKNGLETQPAVHDGPTGAKLVPPIDVRTLSVSRSLEPGSQTEGVKQYVVTAGDFSKVLDHRRGSALLTVQEVEASGKPVGNKQSLLLGHLDAKTRLPVASIGPETRIASCNPQMLTDGLRPQHLFPGANGDIFLGVGKGNRITLATSVSLLPTEAPLKLALGGEGPHWRSVAEMLKDPIVLNDIAAKTIRFGLPFQPERIARWAWEISDQPDLVPKGGVSNGKPYGYVAGGEQLTIQLQPLVPGETVGPMLKFSTLDFRKSWGFRKFPLGFKDAEVLDGPYRMTMPGGEYNHWYLQPKAVPLSSRDTELVHEFASEVRAAGRHNFWDYKIEQFGRLLGPNGEFVMGPNKEPQVVLLDYNSIVRKGVPWLGANERRMDRRYRLD